MAPEQITVVRFSARRRRRGGRPGRWPRLERAGSRQSDWRLGFESLRKEIRIGRCPWTAASPTGSPARSCRNGPALYEVGERTFNHWFDGLGMLHAFTLGRGRVGYANRFLRSSAYKAWKEEGIIRYSEFATDPAAAIFNGAQATFSLAKVPNANVHVGRIAQALRGPHRGRHPGALRPAYAAHARRGRARAAARADRDRASAPAATAAAGSSTRSR